MGRSICRSVQRTSHLSISAFKASLLPLDGGGAPGAGPCAATMLLEM